GYYGPSREHIHQAIVVYELKQDPIGARFVIGAGSSYARVAIAVLPKLTDGDIAYDGTVRIATAGHVYVDRQRRRPAEFIEGGVGNRRCPGCSANSDDSRLPVREIELSVDCLGGESVGAGGIQR